MPRERTLIDSQSKVQFEEAIKVLKSFNIRSEENHYSQQNSIVGRGTLHKNLSPEQ